MTKPPLLNSADASLHYEVPNCCVASLCKDSNLFMNIEKAKKIVVDQLSKCSMGFLLLLM